MRINAFRRTFLSPEFLLPASMAFHPDKLLQSLHHHPAPTHYWVAYSGGVDSHVLLHALAQLRASLGAPLGAVHVHHGLQAQADHWMAYCRQVCADLQLPFEPLLTDARSDPGESPEARAREARYDALRAWLPAGAAVLSAHHQDDQAETLLLQLLRGAGPKGLGAMPAAAVLGRGVLLRPLLGWGRAELLDYAQSQGLKWIEDPSNADTRFDRNFLRHQILPELMGRWPAAARVLSRSAGLCAEAAAQLAALAVQDLGDTRGARPGGLSVAALCRLSDARVRNLLRHWLQEQGLSLPSQAVMERLTTALLRSRADAQPCVHWPGGEVRRYRDELFATTPMAEFRAPAPLGWNLAAPLILESAGGTLRALPAAAGGLRLSAQDRGRLRVAFRQGGEQCRPAGRGHRHSLKQLLQEWGVPPWERERLPLLYLGEELVAVAGLCVMDGYGAAAGEEGWRISWSRWP